ncbi:SMP-30/gluconolactonase/LRE family protein [Nocardioides solisilvae]|uniref:SMP-30/gluconolactonase/LRE family protein n=1 Tax=Nocardioides solisilvae TaxID=1542435 RepID=UPI000D749F17|nr:SMP-30/gluconolactonase/LRE family protein [Nocardioides solisilvae]
MTAADPRLTVHPVPGQGAEDVLVTPEGDVLTGTEDGAIWRLSPDGARLTRVATTGGRPLGLELLPEGDLLVCDAHRGLLAVRRDGSVEELVADVDGRPMRFCNNAAVAADGTVWFSDSSRHHGIEHWKDDFVQDTRSGRLLRRDPDGTVSVVLDGLAFANGVALSAGEEVVVVAETAARRVVRLRLTGDRAGERDLLCDDLPGYPDNVSRGTDGLLWVTVASPRDALVERLQRAPVPVRRAVTRIPEALQPKPRRTIRVQAFDDEGRLVHDLDVVHPGFHMVTGVREHHGRVWMGSLHEPAVAVLDLTEA